MRPPSATEFWGSRAPPSPHRGAAAIALTAIAALQGGASAQPVGARAAPEDRGGDGEASAGARPRPSTPPPIRALGLDSAVLVPLLATSDVLDESAGVDVHVSWKRSRPPLALGLDGGALYSPLVHVGRDDGYFTDHLLIVDLRPRIELVGAWWRIELGLGAGVATERSTWHPADGAAATSTTIAQSASIGLGALVEIADDVGLGARARYTHLFDGAARDTLGLSFGLELLL